MCIIHEAHVLVNHFLTIFRIFFHLNNMQALSYVSSAEKAFFLPMNMIE